MSEMDKDKYPVNNAIGERRAYAVAVRGFLTFLDNNGWLICDRSGNHHHQSPAQWIVESLDQDYKEWLAEKERMLTEWVTQQNKEGGL